MSADSPVTQDAPGGSPSEREALYTQTEFIWQALKETANLVMKASAFYLAAMAAILGYVFSGSSLFQMGRWKSSLPAIKYAIVIRFLAVR